MLDLAQRMKNLRHELGFSQHQLGLEIGCDGAVFKFIEQGRTQKIKPVYSRKISELFDVSREWLEEGIGSMFIEIDEEKRLERMQNSKVTLTLSVDIPLLALKDILKDMNFNELNIENIKSNDGELK